MDWTQKIRTSFAGAPLASPDALGQRNSSVLVTVGIHEDTGLAEILLTKRTMLVDSHKGEISLPGGHWEDHDESLMHTALRECEEEIGIRPTDVEILGALEPVQTHQRVSIYPWVGKINLPYLFNPNPAEVDRILALPLVQLLEEGLKPVSVRVGAINVQSEGLFFQGELVWGATARILAMFREKLVG